MPRGTDPFAAGQPARSDELVDLEKLVTAYLYVRTDSSVSAQRVSFGTSRLTQAICTYRYVHGIDGPLFIGIDTHALSMPAFESALEGLSANNVYVRIARDGEYTPTPVISHAILAYNRGRISGLADSMMTLQREGRG